MATADEDKLFAILAYLGPLILVPFLVTKKSDFVRSHLKQGLMFLILLVAVWIISMIPLIGMIGWGLEIILLIIFIMAIVKVFHGKEFVMPIFGEMARKWSF